MAATPPKKTAAPAPNVRKYRRRKSFKLPEPAEKPVVAGPAKPKRKPPRNRRPPSPSSPQPPPPPPPPPPQPPAEEEELASRPASMCPELEPLPTTSDDDSGLSDIEMPPTVVAIRDSPKPAVKTLRPRNRVLKTYKVNKTIAKARPAASQSAPVLYTHWLTLDQTTRRADASAAPEGEPAADALASAATEILSSA